MHLCDTTTILSEDILHALAGYHDVYINRTFEDDDSGYVLVEGRNGVMVEKPTLKGVYNLTFDDSSLAAEATEELLQNSDVLSVVQNGVIEWFAITPDDDSLSQQWALNNSGQFGGTENADINAPEAWEYETGSENVKIGIIDSGVLGTHEDLSGKVSGDGPTGYFHGTFLAGIAAAKTDNGTGIAGVNWHAPIISKNIDGFDWGNVQTKIVAAVDEGAAVINASWGQFSTLVPVAKACAYAHNMDRVVVAASGNSSSWGLPYPAVLDKVISVAATDHNDGFWTNSNHGPDIDLAAPGVYILSTTLPEDSYEYRTGTSYSAPHVTGVASLLKSYNLDLWNEDIRNIIQLSAKDLGTTGWDTDFGWGRLDAENAFKLMQLPRELDNTLVTSGNTYNYFISGYQYLPMYGIPGLTDNVYRVKVYEVRRDVTFDRPYYYPPAVWGRGAASANSGYVYQDGVPVFNFRDCEVVPGSITNTGCTVSSHVYEVWAWTGQGWSPRGFKPVAPTSVHFAYSVLGEFELLPPTSTSVTADFANERVLIEWDDPNTNEQGYLIEIKPDGGSYSTLDEVDRNVTSYYHTSMNELVGSKLYYYRTIPFTENQENADHGPVVSIRNLANPPSNLDAYPLTRSQQEGGGPGQRIFVSWEFPSNQVSGSIKYYKAEIEYPDHPALNATIDSIYGTSTQFCAPYAEETVNVTVYAMSQQDTLGRPATVQVESGGLEAFCTASHIPPPDQQSTTPPPDSLAKAIVPRVFALEQNYPNPFNPNTSIVVSIPEACPASLEIYNTLGQRIRVLYEGTISAGRHEFSWDGRDDTGNPVSSGVYLYRVDAGAFSETRKMLLLK